MLVQFLIDNPLIAIALIIIAVSYIGSKALDLRTNKNTPTIGYTQKSKLKIKASMPISEQSEGIAYETMTPEQKKEYGFVPADNNLFKRIDARAQELKKKSNKAN